MPRVTNFLFAAAAIFLVGSTLNSTTYAASIHGTISYEGDIPKLREIKMDADPICLTHHKEAVYPEVLVLGEGQSMGNVFVRIKSGIPKTAFAAPEEPVEITQLGCQYTPHVVGVMVDQPLRILNPDGTLHNVHALPKVNAEFNLAMPKFRKEMTKKFGKAEFMFPIKCDVHPWMGAWIAVMSHPFFAVTQADGQFSIDDLPPGEYEIEAWHEKLGKRNATVSVAAQGDTVEQNFTFSRPSK